MPDDTNKNYFYCAVSFYVVKIFKNRMIFVAYY